MPPEPPHAQHSLPRSHVVEVIARGREDILRQLREAGIPETETLNVIRRFADFSVQVLREQDRLYREYKELLAEAPERAADHQEWLETKAGGLRLTMEAFIADLVTAAINKAKTDYRDELTKEVIIPSPLRQSIWEEALHALGQQLRDPLVYRSIGLTVWFLIWYFAIGSWIAGVAAIGSISVAEYFLKKAGLLAILIAGGMFLLLLATGGVR
jgi:hypothetical protein